MKKYYNKYVKYKSKYILLKQKGGDIIIKKLIKDWLSIMNISIAKEFGKSFLFTGFRDKVL